MKLVIRLVLAVAAVLFAGDSAFAQAQPHAAAPPNPLEKLAWLEGKWTVNAVVPGSSDAMLRESYFEWAANRRALRFWSFVTPPGGQRRPYVEGWYIWDPLEKKIRFAYVDPGGLYEGEVKVEGATLEHVFTGKSNRDGSTARWRYTLSDAGDGTMPTRIYSEKSGAWHEFVFLTYQKQK